jgi:hypothetical protein
MVTFSENFFDLLIAALWLKLFILVEQVLEFIQPILAFLLLVNEFSGVYLAILLDVWIALELFDQHINSFNPNMTNRT